MDVGTLRKSITDEIPVVKEFRKGANDPDAFMLWYTHLAKNNFYVASKIGHIEFAILLLRENLIKPYYFLEDHDQFIQFKVVDSLALEQFSNKLIAEFTPKPQAEKELNKDLFSLGLFGLLAISIFYLIFLNLG